MAFSQGTRRVVDAAERLEEARAVQRAEVRAGLERVCGAEGAASLLGGADVMTRLLKARLEALVERERAYALQQTTLRKPRATRRARLRVGVEALVEAKEALAQTKAAPGDYGLAGRLPQDKGQDVLDTLRWTVDALRRNPFVHEGSFGRVLDSEAVAGRLDEAARALDASMETVQRMEARVAKARDARDEARAAVESVYRASLKHAKSLRDLIERSELSKALLA